MENSISDILKRSLALLSSPRFKTDPFTVKKRQPVLIELQLEDLEILMAEDIKHLPHVLEHCFCTGCRTSRPMTDNYSIYLDALNDVVLVGSCTKCAHPMQRHLELGENKETSAVANHIRYIKKNYTSSSR